MGTRIDFDEALLNKEETKRRLAAGEQLDVYMDGLPFTYLREPEDVDYFEPRQKNPTAELRVKPAAHEKRARGIVAKDGRLLLEDADMRTARGRMLLHLRKKIEEAGRLRSDAEIERELLEQGHE